jgi:hypothetical protein
MTRLAPGLYEYTNGDVRLTVADVEAKGGELRAWIEVHEGGRRVHYGDHNLRGPRTIPTMAQACAARSHAKVDWHEWLGECCYQVIHDTLTGDAAVELTGSEARPPGWLLKGLVEDEQATSLFGYGETGKSLIALAGCATIASGNSSWLGLEATVEGPTLTCDWEATGRTWDWRLTQLAQGAKLPIPKGVWHRHEALPLAKILPSVAKEIARTHAVLLVIDSVSRARTVGGDWGQQGTGELYAALAKLDVPTLLIDHRAKNSDETKRDTPWGAVQNFNNLRLGWAVRATGVSGGFDIRLKRAKANNWGQLPDHAWQVRFTPDNRQVRFQTVDPLLVLPGGDATVKDRIMGVLLSAGPEGVTSKQAASEVGVTDNNARAVLSSLKKAGQAVQVAGRWLAESQWEQEEAPF